jgi:predicted amino acid dehydrogenase
MEPGVGVTTGNSLTIGVGLDSIRHEISKIKLDAPGIKLGVIGAAGNIASVYASCLLGEVSEIRLLGSSSESGARKVEELAKDMLWSVFTGNDSRESGNPRSVTDVLKHVLLSGSHEDVSIRNRDGLWECYKENFGEKGPLRVASDLSEVKSCHVVIVCTNQSEPFLQSSHFTPGALVYDISVPANCTGELISNDQGIKVTFGGIAALPGDEDLPLKGFPLDKGQAYGCISETIVLGFEEWRGNYSFGPVTHTQVNHISELARKHGILFYKAKILSI